MVITSEECIEHGEELFQTKEKEREREREKDWEAFTGLRDIQQ
jgi:hypothetical protein